MECQQYQPHSPDNPAFAWCAKFEVYLDAQGRFCRRCHTDTTFRKILHKQLMVRRGQGCTTSGGYCEIFNIATTPEQCAQCQQDGEYRAFLRGQGAAAAKERKENCPRRGQVLRVEKRVCCGGKERELEIFACEIKGETHRGICAVCNNA